jgi:hypothetical protein
MAKDVFHNSVKAALQKEGWTITHDPYELAVGGVEMYIDLGAEQLLGAEREGVKIAVEIKSFIRPERDRRVSYGSRSIPRLSICVRGRGTRSPAIYGGSCKSLQQFF